ncbi:hypothetical protein [Spartinivicinus ruber]|nr:hypothetical protein [Spartinivicinus ruber]
MYLPDETGCELSIAGALLSLSVVLVLLNTLLHEIAKKILKNIFIRFV